jgi:hypothetical protein
VKVFCGGNATDEFDPALQRRGQPEHDTALHLLLDDVRVHHGAAIDGADDASHRDGAAARIDLDYLGDACAIALEARDPAADAARQGLLPAVACGREAQHRLHARVMLRQSESQLERVTPGVRCDLVDEALEHPAVVGMAH